MASKFQTTRYCTQRTIDSKIYIVGLRARHHSAYSGYEGFRRYVGTTLKPPVNFDWLSSYWGWRVDKAIADAISRPHYSLGLLLTEGAAALHMLGKRKSLYHLIYGDMGLWLLSKLNKNNNNRLVATFHEPPSTLEWMAIDKIIEKLDAAILVSESQRTYFDAILPKERIFVVPHGIDTVFFQPLEKLSNEPVCITVGSHLRDFKTLGAAMHLVWQVQPSVRLIAVGTRLDRDSKVKFKLDDDRIEFLEGISDEQLREVYQTARLAVFSFGEATANNAMLEAMAVGLPIVATDVGGLREYLGDEAAIYSQPSDPNTLATNILKLLENRPFVTKMALASHSRALKFDFSLIAQQMEQVYTQILK